MKVLTILMSIPLDKRNYYKLGIKTYLKFFDKIQIFYVNEGYYYKNDNIYKHKKIEIIKIDYFYQLIKFFNKNQNSLYLDFTLPGLKSLIIKTILHLKKEKVVNFKLGSVPESKKLKKINSIFAISKNFKTLHYKVITLIENNFLIKKRIFYVGEKK